MTTKGNKKSELTIKQKKFCLLYATKEDFLGNGVKAYAEAYSVDLLKKGKYESAKTNAWRLLTNADILREIDSILKDKGLNDSFIDKQLYFLIQQNADFGVKLRAVQEYNKLRKRYSAIEIDMRVEHEEVNLNNYKEKLKQMTDDDLIRELGEQARQERAQR